MKLPTVCINRGFSVGDNINFFEIKTKGFTLVELVLVIAILALLIIVSLPLAINFYQARQFDVYKNGIVQTLRRAQLKAMSVEADSSFGFYISSDSKKYVLFKGNSYNTRDDAWDEVFELPDNLLISGITEVVFTKLRGIPSDTGNLSLMIDNRTETININEMGRINY
jgi:prepilin-type N-terminal cleavage/methylation domain-containing protein